MSDTPLPADLFGFGLRCYMMKLTFSLSPCQRYQEWSWSDHSLMINRTSRKFPGGSSPPKWDLCRLSLLHKQQYTRSNSFPTWLQLKRNVCVVIIWEIGGHHTQAAKAWMWTWARNKGIWSSKFTVTMKPTLARKKMFTHLQIPMILNKTTAFPFISGKTCDV